MRREHAGDGLRKTEGAGRPGCLVHDGDERHIVLLIRDDDLSATVVCDGVEALHALSATAFDAVVLDRNLPRLHGDQVCREIVREPVRPAVRMMSGAGEVRDRVAGLEIGADDYLVNLLRLLNSWPGSGHTADAPEPHCNLC